MKSIQSQILGTLHQNSMLEYWGESGPTEIPYFNGKKMVITFIDFTPSTQHDFIQQADKALSIFFKKGNKERIANTTPVYKNCIHFLEAVGYDKMDKPMWEMKDETQVWNFVSPSEIYISHEDSNMYLAISCECDWEQEHGLQLVFKNGDTLTKVSEQDGQVTEEYLGEEHGYPPLPSVPRNLFWERIKDFFR